MAEKDAEWSPRLVRGKRLKVRFVDGSTAEYDMPESFDVASMFTGSPHLVAMTPCGRGTTRWLNPAHVVTVCETLFFEEV